MEQAVISVSALGILAAICSRMTSGTRYIGVLRLALGLQIIRVCISSIAGLPLLAE